MGSTQPNQISNTVTRAVRSPFGALLKAGGSTDLTNHAAKGNCGGRQCGDALIPQVTSPTHKGLAVTAKADASAFIGRKGGFQLIDLPAPRRTSALIDIAIGLVQRIELTGDGLLGEIKIPERRHGRVSEIIFFFRVARAGRKAYSAHEEKRPHEKEAFGIYPHLRLLSVNWGQSSRAWAVASIAVYPSSP